MTYLIAMSFILHFISFFLIVILVQKINGKNTLGETNDQEKLKREIEDLLVAYTAEMKEENDKLVNKIVFTRKTSDQNQAKTIKDYESQRLEMTTKKAPLPPYPKKTEATRAEVVEEEFAPPILVESTDIVEQSSTAQVLSLATQGFSAIEIAQRLGLGAGEVELLLKFRK
ncbi:MAG: DUF6115 domain-containing protein [Anaerobacillus sp.]|uniref:DUF6115 domain-containing protein n=1 Tax=Anaerobacillus sp. TaxID=1872506 RepID=UPI00391AB910